MKATEQYFPVLLLLCSTKELFTFKSVDEILKSDLFGAVTFSYFTKKS